MAKTPNVALRFDPAVYEAFQELMATEGKTVTADLESYMSKRTGVKVTKKRTGLTLTVPCPSCEAATGAPCVNIYTKELVGRPHPERIKKAAALAETRDRGRRLVTK